MQNHYIKRQKNRIEYLFIGGIITLKKGDDLMPELNDTVNLARNAVSIRYIGQEGFIFGYKNLNIAIDPYLSYYVDENCSEPVKWKRKYAPPVKPEKLGFLDYVFCTHTHYDHADPVTLGKIAKAGDKTKFVVPLPETDTFLKYGIEKKWIIGVKCNETTALSGFSFEAIPAAHEEFHRDENGDYRETGYIFYFGKYKFCHLGDTLVYDGLEKKITRADVAFIPVNGRDYFRNSLDILGNTDANEAAKLAKKSKVKLFVPMHHDLYEVNGESNARVFEAADRYNPDGKIKIFRPNETIYYAR